MKQWNNFPQNQPRRPDHLFSNTDRAKLEATVATQAATILRDYGVLDRLKVYEHHAIEEAQRFEALQTMSMTLADGSQLYIHQLNDQAEPDVFEEPIIEQGLHRISVEDSRFKKVLSITVWDPGIPLDQRPYTDDVASLDFDVLHELYETLANYQLSLPAIDETVTNDLGTEIHAGQPHVTSSFPAVCGSS